MAAAAAEAQQPVTAQAVSSLLLNLFSVVFFFERIEFLIDFVGAIGWERIRGAVLCHTASVTRTGS